MRIGNLVVSTAVCVVSWFALDGQTTPAQAQHLAMCNRPDCQCAAGGACIPNRTSFGYYQGQWRRWPGVAEADARRAAAERPVAPPADMPAVQVPSPNEEAGGGPMVRPKEANTSDDGVDFSPTATPEGGAAPRGVDPPPLPPRDPTDAVPSLPEGLMRRGSQRGEVAPSALLWPGIDATPSGDPLKLDREPIVRRSDDRGRAQSNTHDSDTKPVIAFGSLPGGLRANPLRMQSESSAAARNTNAKNTPASVVTPTSATRSEEPGTTEGEEANEASTALYLVAPKVGNTPPKAETDIDQEELTIAPTEANVLADPRLLPAEVDQAAELLPTKPRPETNLPAAPNVEPSPTPQPSSAARVAETIRDDLSLSRQNPFRSSPEPVAATNAPARQPADRLLSELSESSRSKTAQKAPQATSQANTAGTLTTFDLPASPERMRDDGQRRFQIRIDPRRSQAPTEEPAAIEPEEDLEISPRNPLRSR